MPTSAADPRRVGLFELPPPPRAVKLREGSRAARLLVPGIALLVTGVVTFLLGKDLWELGLLVSDGVRTTGTVTDMAASSNRQQRDISFHLYYSYDAGGTRYRGERSVNRPEYERSSTGQELPVTYARSRPWIHRPTHVAASDVVQRRVMAVLIVAAMLFAVAAIGIGLHFAGSGQLGLAREGTATTGHVLFVTPTRRGDIVTFAFTIPVDLEGEAKSYIVDAKGLEPGSPVTVVYDDSRPARNALWLDIDRTIRLVP